MRPGVRERLYARATPCPDAGCQCLLRGGCTNSRGYAVISVGGERKLAHRVAWQLDRGEIPAGLTIDHVRDRDCTHKTCINVAHLEPVTNLENNRRSHAHRVYRPHRRALAETGPGPEFLRHFHEWAGPEEWADLTPDVRALALAATTP